MSLASDGKSVVYEPTILQKIEELGPQFLTLASMEEGFRVADCGS